MVAIASLLLAGCEVGASLPTNLLNDDYVRWPLGIVLPFLLIASAAKLVIVRAETRHRDAERALRRHGQWMSRSRQYWHAHQRFWNRFEKSVNSRGIRTGQGWWHWVMAGVYGLMVGWIRIRARPNRFLSGFVHAEVRSDRNYMRKKAETYSDRIEADRADGKKFVSGGWGGMWGTLFGRGGRWVIVGAAVTITTAGLFWAVGPDLTADAPGHPGRYAWTRSIGAMLWICVIILNTERARFFCWGCAMAVYLGLTTLDVSPLRTSVFRNALDAQLINAVFLGVGIVLALCAYYDRDGALGRVGPLETNAVRQSYRLTWWSRIGGTASRAIRMRESYWCLLIVVLYVALTILVTWPLVDGVWLNATSTPDGGVTPLVGITIGALGIPGFVFLRTVRARTLSLVYCVLALALLALLASIHASTTPSDPDPVEAPTEVTAEERDTLAQGIQFATGSYELADSAKQVLRTKVDILRRHNGLRVRIVGHTDSRGPRLLNNVLGMQRAVEACRALTAEGLGPGRFLLISLGETDPLTANQTAQQRALNRRVEFEIVATNETDSSLEDGQRTTDLVAWEAEAMRLVANCPR